MDMAPRMILYSFSTLKMNTQLLLPKPLPFAIAKLELVQMD
jgi:hypothetical protein